MTDTPPALHILAGPNGAGKSTLYAAFVRRVTDAEFVNADDLALQALGRHATSQVDAELGQRLAEERRAALMSARRSLVAESTFSHPSKIDLVRQAKAAGYWVAVYHINLETPDLAVARVSLREAKGGHPVPEDRIRGRYERNQPLIREAVRLADQAHVFDNSIAGVPPQWLIGFAGGKIQKARMDLPAWAASLYATDLAGLLGN
ncbi:MAG: zeta toxin family protein [Caulobacterales bacterium]